MTPKKQTKKERLDNHRREESKSYPRLRLRLSSGKRWYIVKCSAPYACEMVVAGLKTWDNGVIYLLKQLVKEQTGSWPT